MKIRNGFVSNSSSSSFIITNTTNKKLNVEDFAKETTHLVDEFNKEYDCEEYNHEINKKNYLKSAKSRANDRCSLNKPIPSKASNIWTFGDEDGDVMGEVLDYMLRDGGETKSFKWKFYEYNR